MHQKKMCDFYYNNKFDNNDASVVGIICLLQNALNKFCPIFKLSCSHDIDNIRLGSRTNLNHLWKRKINCIQSIAIWLPE